MSKSLRRLDYSSFHGPYTRLQWGRIFATCERDRQKEELPVVRQQAKIAQLERTVVEAADEWERGWTIQSWTRLTKAVRAWRKAVEQTKESA